jgi:hypothetical protein
MARVRGKSELASDNQERAHELFEERQEALATDSPLPADPAIDRAMAAIEETLRAAARPANPGCRASAVIHFSGTAEPGCAITFSHAPPVTGPLPETPSDEDDLEPEPPEPVDWVYLEADEEDLANGVWTNGASAAESAASFVAAINGDLRGVETLEGEELPPESLARPDLNAFVLDDGVSVLVHAYGGCAMQISTDSASAVLVEDMHVGHAPGNGQVTLETRTVTERDLDAGQVVFLLQQRPRAFALLPTRDDGGALKSPLPGGALSYEGEPDRLSYLLSGTGDPVAGDVMQVMVQE